MGSLCAWPMFDDWLSLKLTFPFPLSIQTYRDIHVLLCPRATACLSPFPFSPTDTTTRLASLLHKAGESLQEGEGAGSLPSSSVLGGGGGPVMVPQVGAAGNLRGC